MLAFGLLLLLDGFLLLLLAFGLLLLLDGFLLLLAFGLLLLLDGFLLIVGLLLFSEFWDSCLGCWNPSGLWLLLGLGVVNLGLAGTGLWLFLGVDSGLDWGSSLGFTTSERPPNALTISNHFCLSGTNKLLSLFSDGAP